MQSPAKHYDFLPDGYEDIFVAVQAPVEIMADKLLAFLASSKCVRSRDIWDLAWLDQKNTKVDISLVHKKLYDFRENALQQKLASMILRVPEVVSNQSFLDEMKRVLPLQTFERTLGRSQFSSYLSDTVTRLLVEVQTNLGEAPESERFRMSFMNEPVPLKTGWIDPRLQAQAGPVGLCGGIDFLTD